MAAPGSKAIQFTVILYSFFTTHIYSLCKSWFYLQKISRIWPFLNISTTIPLQAAIISCLHYHNGLLLRVTLLLLIRDPFLNARQIMSLHCIKSGKTLHFNREGPKLSQGPARPYMIPLPIFHIDSLMSFTPHHFPCPHDCSGLPAFL